jgi:hypothetical protein
VAATSVAWIATTLMTRPESEQTLVRFYRLVRPAGPGWTAVAARAGVSASPDSLPTQFLSWVLGCAFVYASLFGAGSVLYGHTAQALVWGVVWIASGAWLWRVVANLRTAPAGAD